MRHTLNSRTALAILVLVAGCRSGLPQAVPNDNRVPAGVQRGDTLVFELDAQRAAWRPDTDVDTAITVFAFAARDGVPRVPGPLLRVSAGTVVEIRVTNHVPDSALLVRGLHPGTAGDTMRVASGATRTTYFTAARPGTYLYWASISAGRDAPSEARDGPLAGAIVVDDPRLPRDTNERILVLTALDILPDTTKPEPRDDLFDLAINSLSWPHTERLRYAVGDTVRWRVLNATANEHPMHLHGFHFTVTARGDGSSDTTYVPAGRRTAVTEYVVAGSTVQMEWSPTRPGSWLFHCHINDHVVPFPLRADSTRAHAADAHDPVEHARRSMTGLVMGIEVQSRTPDQPHPVVGDVAHRLRLFAQQSGAAAVDDTAFARGYALQRGPTPPRADSIVIPGPILLLTRGERTAITVVNRLPEATSVHWHGMELESYYDGVAGWSGADTRRAPMIAPGDSFVAIMTPPRSGTFMYHPHMDEEDQLAAGMFGAMLVLEPGERFDPSTDLPFVIGRGITDGKRGALVNGARVFTPVRLRAGTSYRMRFLNLGVNAPAKVVLHIDSIPLRWTPRAKDGADLPPTQSIEQLSTLRRIAVGETYDFVWKPTRAMRATLEITVLDVAGFRIPIEVR